MNILNIILMIASLLAIISAVVFSLVYRKRLEYKTGLQLTDMMQRHYGEVKNIYKTMRGWRHDYHNHIQTMKGHMSLSQHNELGQYLNELDTDLIKVDNLIKSGNLTLDAILNSKVSLANESNIKITLDAYAQDKMTVTDIDLCIIIGNLMDNAIDACINISKEADRFIRIYVGILREQLYVSITNATAEKVRNDSGFYETKKDKLTHGQGLKRVDKVIEKYDGFLNRQNEPGVFSTEIMLPL